MKKCISYLLSFIMVFTMISGVLLPNDARAEDFPAISATVDGQTMSLRKVGVSYNGQPINSSVPAVLYQSRTMIPLRVISETMGGQVTWDPNSLGVKILLDDNVLELNIDSNSVKVNGVQKQIDYGVPPKLINGNTMVPVRFLAEQLACKVEWDESNFAANVIKDADDYIGQKEDEAAEGYVRALVDGKELDLFKVAVNYKGSPMNLDFPAVLYNERTMVPLRAISETIGAQVEWDPNTLGIKVILNGKQIKLNIDSTSVYVNGTAKTIAYGVSPKLIDGNTMVPLRFLSDELGIEVSWDEATGTANLEPKAQQVADQTLNSVNSVTKETVNGREAIVIRGSKVSPEVIMLKFDNKLALDFMDSKINIPASGSLSTSTVYQYRASQYNNADNRYPAGKYVTRVVLDMNSSVGGFSFETSNKDNALIVYITNTNPIQQQPQKPQQPAEQPAQPNGKTIVLDAGHGGSDPGAISASGAYNEKTINLSVTKKLESLLKSRGYNVVLTRSGDSYVGLTERGNISNSAGGDVFVSVHFNAASAASATGIESFYFPGSTQGNALASAIQSKLIAATNAYNRGVKSAAFTVLDASDCVAVLVELGFITNPNDESKLATDSYHNLTAKAIADGIDAYLGR